MTDLRVRREVDADLEDVSVSNPFPVSIENKPEVKLTGPTAPTYRTEIGVIAGGAGFAAELIPGPNRKLIVHAVYFSKPSAAVTMRLLRNATASTGGTSTNSPITPMDSTHPAGSTTCKIFTAAPTAGAQVGGDLFEGVIGTGDVLYEEFGQNGQGPLVLRGENQTLAVNVSAAATIVGYIEFSEEAA